jgi:SSS family solute:Na+ symporter
MLTLINTTYFGITQFFPGMMIILFFRKVNPLAIALGIIVGQVLAILFYAQDVSFGGFNIGLVCLLINIAVVLSANYLAKLGKMDRFSGSAEFSGEKS